MTYRVSLQFCAGGPAVTGEWTEDSTALRTWNDWVKLYGGNESASILLTEDSQGRESMLALWKDGRLVEGQLGSGGSSDGH